MYRKRFYSMKQSTKGSFTDFYHLVSFLLPDFNKFIVNRSFISLLYESIKLIPVYLVKLIIDNILLQPDLKKVIFLIAATFFILVTLTIIEMLSFNYVLQRIGIFQRKLLERLHEKLIHLPLSFHEKQSTGSIISKINKAANYTGELLWFVNNDITPTIFQIILTAILLLITEWHIGLIYVIALPLVLWFISENGKKAQPYREAYHKVFDAATGEFVQTIYNVKTVKDYVQEKREFQTYSHMLKEYVKRLKERWQIEMWFITWRETFTNAIRCFTMFIAVWFVLKGFLTPGDLVLVFTLNEKAFINIHRLGRIYNFLGDSHESLARARKILEEPNTLKEPLLPKTAQTKTGTIECKQVNFSYGSEEVLKNISFALPPKKIIAIIGESGSGKSTLIKLITRHYDPTKGAILLDSIDLRRLSLNALRKRIAVVSQQTEIFNRTIHENIAYGKPTATRKEVIEAAKKANAHKFIMEFKNKYDTLVGERGIRLSGGQQQRISIARALLANPEILIFDEATSSLDSESEINIQKALFSTRGKYTMIIIAHRLSTIEHADLVMVMDKGKVAEMGTHQELLKKKDSLYKKMRELQRLGELRP